MSASKARKVVRIHPDKDPSKWMVTVEDPKTGATDAVALTGLVRPELARAAKLAFPNVDGRGWIHFGNEAIREAIVTNVLPDGIGAAIEKMQAPRPQSAGESKRDAVIERMEARIRDLERQVSDQKGAGLDLVRVMEHDGTVILIGVMPDHHVVGTPM